MNLVATISIKSRIFIGFITITCFIVILSLIAYQAILETDSSFSKYEKINQQSQYILTLENTTSDLQRGVQDYIHTGYEAIAARTFQNLDEFEITLRDRKRIFLDNTQAVQYLTRMKEHIDNYHQGFKYAVEERRKREHLVKQILLFKSELLKSVDITDSLKLLVIESENELLSYLDDPNVLKVNKVIERLDYETSLVKSKSLKKQLINFKAKYIEVVQSNRGFLFLISVVMAAEAQEFSFITKQFKNHILEQVDPIRTELHMETKQTLNIIVVTAIVLSLLGLFFSIFISRSINKPLERLTATFKRLANDEFVEKVPGLELKDEIGEMSKAAEVFRQNNEATKELVKKLDNTNQQLEDAANELAKASKFLEGILTNAVDAIISINIKGEIRSVNPAAVKLFGHSTEEMVGQNVNILMPSPYHEEHDSYLKNYDDTSQKKIIGIGREVIGQRKDGSTFPMELSVSENRVGDSRSFTGIIRDISEQKEAEKKIKEALSFNELIMENIPDFIFIKDRQLNVVKANAAFLSAYPEAVRENMIGTTAVDLHVKEEAEDFNAADQKAFAEGYSEVEEIIQFPDGITRTLTTKKVRFENAKGEEFILGVGRDISDRKKTEIKLAEYNKKIEIQKIYYESLIDDLGAPVFVIDHDHTVITWNKACEELTGLAAEEVIGTNNHSTGFYSEKRNMLADLIIEKDYSKIDELYPEKFLESKLHDEHLFVETWNEMKNGERRYIRAFCNSIYDENDNIIAVAEVLLDMTKLKESYTSIEERQQELERSNSELERFAYVASHDLQEPLRMVSSYTQLLEKRYQDQLDQTAKEYIRYAFDGALQMRTLINDLLSFSRINTEKRKFTVINTNNICREVLGILRVGIEEVKATVIQDELPSIKGDEAQIRQLFQNIIANAIKYGDKKRKNNIHISAVKKGMFYQFNISDSGIGIEAEYFEKIFVIFKRLHSKTEFTGTGIGLAICKKIVEAHGGEIWLESVLGKGATFYFTLPVSV